MEAKPIKPTEDEMKFVRISCDIPLIGLVAKMAPGFYGIYPDRRKYNNMDKAAEMRSIWENAVGLSRQARVD